MPTSYERGPRRAATVMFFVAGWLPAAWGTRIPAIKAELHLSAGALALGILGLEAGGGRGRRVDRSPLRRRGRGGSGGRADRRGLARRRTRRCSSARAHATLAPAPAAGTAGVLRLRARRDRLQLERRRSTRGARRAA